MSIDEHPVADLTYEVLPHQAEPAVPPRNTTEPSAAIGKPRWYQRGLGRVAVNHLVNFCRQFTSYLDAGINLYPALESLRRQYERTASAR